MFHDRQLAAATADPRPASAVSGAVGWAGLAGLAAWIALAWAYGMDGPSAALCALPACALPMVAWSLGVDKVHRRASTGIDWSLRRPWREAAAVSAPKLAGLWLTWAAIALVYALGRFWWRSPYLFAMQCLGQAAPVLLALSVPYVLWLDRRLVSPRDGCWALGAWVTGRATLDREAVAGHLRAWAVKGFFLAFMLAIVPGGFGQIVRADWRQVLSGPVPLTSWLVSLMFVVDVMFGTVGYLLTTRPLDSHIRSANPYAAAWTAALICYPPFVLMGEGGPLDYHPGTADWSWWFGGHPVALGLLGAALVVLTAIYAAATVAFGLRFSNLTHRGVLTHGVYGWSRHPAYLSKNLFWWLSTLPMLGRGSWTDLVRATLLMAVVSGVYWWRARTEERHLSADPAYRAYWDWMERRGAVPRFVRWLKGTPAG